MRNWDTETRWIVWGINTMLLTIFMICAIAVPKDGFERGIHVFTGLFCLGLNSYWAWLD